MEDIEQLSMAIPLNVASEPRKFTDDTSNKRMASEQKSSSFDRNATGWVCMRSCMEDSIDDLTSLFTSKSEGLGENLQLCSFEESFSSYSDDDEGSRESSQPSVSRVDQVPMSPMADDISEVS